jgi:hypothetical protein
VARHPNRLRFRPRRWSANCIEHLRLSPINRASPPVQRASEAARERRLAMHLELRHSTRPLKLLLYIILVIAFLWAANCQGPEKAPVENRAAAPPAASPAVDSHGLHVLHQARLRDIMRDLQRMNFPAISEEIAATNELNRDICDVSRHAAALAADAHVIPVIFEDHEMSPESRRVLNMLAARLHLQALELQEAADRSDVSLVRERLDRMIETCNDCHNSFRAPPVAGILLTDPLGALPATVPL